jgi:superfamily I DNA and/or RNA helicase
MSPDTSMAGRHILNVAALRPRTGLVLNVAASRPRTGLVLNVAASRPRTGLVLTVMAGPCPGHPRTNGSGPLTP